MNADHQKTFRIATLTFLRIIIGWHFLFEGISKLAIEGWSSAAYLMESKWLLSGTFHWIVTHPTVLSIVDFMNIWGLILIGLGLFMGLLTRVSSISGILLLLLYYIANPPFIEMSYSTTTPLFFINLNLVEASILLIFAFSDQNEFWGLDRLMRSIRHQKEHFFPASDNHDFDSRDLIPRRELIKNLVALPLLGVAFWSFVRKYGWFSHEEDNLAKVDALSNATILSAKKKDLGELAGTMPKGKIKDMEISRIIPGGNLVAGFAHARDLIYVSNMIKNYFTDEKVIECLWLYEACGINTTIMRTDEQTIRILKKYWKRGGKIQWLAQTYPDGSDLTNVKLAIDNGARGAFVMGAIADRLVYGNRLEDLSGAIEYIRSQGLVAGTAGHAIQVPVTCMERGIETDFFMKTFHHDHYWSAQPPENRQEFMHDLTNKEDRLQFHDNLWCPSSEKVAAYFKNCTTPWIAYKVLAAGAINPEDGFRYAFEQGADFICVGMFDFQIIPNANIVYHTLNSDLNRKRKWFA